MTTYAVTQYKDGQVLGHVELTDEQFLLYKSICQQPEGIMRLGDMPHDLYELDEDYQDTHEDTTVFLA